MVGTPGAFAAAYAPHTILRKKLKDLFIYLYVCVLSVFVSFYYV